MKKYMYVRTLAVILAITLNVLIVWVAEAQTNQAPPQANQDASQILEHYAMVGRNPAHGSQADPNPDGGTDTEATKNENQVLFEESLQHLMPLSEEQIYEYRQHSDRRERALLPVSPHLNSRTVRVSLEPGKSPVTVQTTANIATSLVFHDCTGKPWPITSVTNGGPNFFQVLRPELQDGNLLNVMPMQDYGASTLVITLEGKDIPLVIRLESDSVRSPKRKADALLLFQLAHRGPHAETPITNNIQETVTSDMLAFLDHVPPKDAVIVKTKSKYEKLTIWKYQDKHYIRTNHTLMWPAWSAVVNGAGNIKCYEVPITSRFILSCDGTMESVLLQNATSTREVPHE